MKLQKAVIKDVNGQDTVSICEVSNPEQPVLLMSFFNSWNNTFVADHIIDLLINDDTQNRK